MNSQESWYKIEQIKELDSPALIVYPERIKQNILLLKKMVSTTSKIRPHIKTCKARETILLMMNEGITKFKCATIAEAEMLALCKAPDILLAYQPTETKLHRLIQLTRQYSDSNFSCLVDNLQSAQLFSTIAAAENIKLSVYIDLNVGMDRTGINPGSAAVDLFEYISATSDLNLLGFHAYDGHIRASDYQKRTQMCNESFIQLELLRETIESKGYGYPLLIAGGSPSFMIHALRENVEVSPGTFIFWDKGYSDSIPEQKFQCAAVVLTRIISLPTATKICIDLGYKSIASENDLQHRLSFLNAPNLKPVSHSEEHMVLEAGKNHNFKIGDVLYAVPFHICPTVALYQYAVVVDKNKINDRWEIIARNRQISL
jgi:D-threonine aldolase